MKRNLPYVLLTILAPAAVFAQSVLSTQYPLGLPQISRSGIAMSMGGAATGVPEPFHIMTANPANLGAIKNTTFSALVSFNLLQTNDNGDESLHARLAPQQISFSLPLGIAGTVGFSLAKRSEAAVQFRPPSELIGMGFEVRKGLNRQGGLTEWEIAMGREITKWAYAGLAYRRIYFTQRTTIIEEVVGENFISTRDSTSHSFGGNGLSIGFMGSFDKISFGLAYEYAFANELEFDRNIRRSKMVSTDAPSIRDTSFTRDLRPPPAFSIGAGYEISPKWLVAADLIITQWQQYTSDNLLPEASRDNAVTLGGGARFIPSPSQLSPRYFEVINYRAGARYSQLPDKNSAEFAFSLGAGFPLKSSGLLDAILTMGSRFDDRYDDYRENFFSLAFGFNGGRNAPSSEGITLSK